MCERKPIGLWSASFLVVANMIGAAVFTTSGYALADLGSASRVLAAWVVGGGIACCGAIGYGRLARLISESGGEYLFLSRIVHPALGFTAGWISLLAGFTGAIAFAATTLEIYLIPAAARPPWLPPNLVAAFLILVLGFLHASDVRFGTVGQNILVMLKISLIFAFLGLASALLTQVGQLTLPTPPTTAFSVPAFAMSLVWISLAYSGFNAAVYLAEEVQDARRTVPRALILGTLLVTGIYFLLNTVFVGAVPFEMAAGQPDIAAVAASYLGGPRLAIAIRLIIVLSLTTSVSAMLQAGPRVLVKMAQDGLLPKALVPGTRPPRWATAVQVTLACIVVLIMQLQQQLSYLGFTLSLSAAATVAASFWIRDDQSTGVDNLQGNKSRDPNEPRTQWWELAAAAIFVAATLIVATLAVSQRPLELVASLMTIVTGFVMYAVIQRWQRRRNPFA